MGAELVAEFPAWVCDDNAPEGGRDFPETMRLDNESIHILYLNFVARVATCACLLGVQQCLKISLGCNDSDAVGAAIASVRDTLIADPPVKSNPARTVASVVKVLLVSPTTREVASQCGSAAAKMMDPLSAVYKSLHKAYKRQLAVSVWKNGETEGARVASVCDDPRMDAVLRADAKCLRVIMDLNRKVHGRRYTDIVTPPKGM